LRDKFKIGLVTGGKSKDLEKFVKGEMDHLIGTSYYYGTLVRGLDLPEKVKYAIFVGCPVFKIRFEEIDSVSPKILRILALLCRKRPEIEPFLMKLNKIEEDLELQKELRRTLKLIIERGEIDAKDVVVKNREIIFPDVRTYIQASGRTSRLFAGGITKGASFLFEKDEEILRAFIERAKFFEIEFKKFENVDLEKLKREIEESRVERKDREEFIRPILFIVESPTKAKQISKFFGKPSIKVIEGVVVYEIPMEKYVLLTTATLGHLTDLITNRSFHGVEVDGRFVPIYASIKRCKNCGNQFTEERKDCPRCESSDIDDSKKRIECLRKLAKDTGLIVIGTDPDSEGEKIAWDLSNLLAGCGEIKRAEFHEVTRRAIVKALNSLRDVRESLVKAQVARRIEDRWIGFVLSQKLWGVFGNRNLSAGRAQTPVLGWVIGRYKESRKKKTIALIKNFDLILEYDKKEFEIEINLINEKIEKRTPLPPYTTDAMLKDANSILKLSVTETMKTAQELFELGLITYHRTDSTKVSDVGLRIAKDYLGDDFFAREWTSEGAHECIRPTRPIDKETLQRLIEEGILPIERLSWRHYTLYDLIFRRFMASQCKPFEVKTKTYEITFDGKKLVDERVVSARGKAYELYKSVWVRSELPIGKFKVHADVKKIQSIPLFSQSDVISLMKEKGIGRPSTYATILDKLFMRGYVIEKGRKLIPTKLGITVYDYLERNYWKFVNEERTRSLEEKMDTIEKGYLDLNVALKELYDEVRQIG
ncbi:MAG: reverse gyrase, partial [Archaeoglobaceae archaeon]|nr:reverse gyrase [Archaeoglobaceae archaeon]MDW8013581.1 reverse gyrase [Archaeoglobaceae archaeon]